MRLREITAVSPDDPEPAGETKIPVYTSTEEGDIFTNIKVNNENVLVFETVMFVKPGDVIGSSQTPKVHLHYYRSNTEYTPIAETGDELIGDDRTYTVNENDKFIVVGSELVNE